MFLRIGTFADGAVQFQKAYVDLKYNRWRLRAGQFSERLIAEGDFNPTDLLFTDYSEVESFYEPGATQGVGGTYDDDTFTVDVGASDGLRAGFAEFQAPIEADYAVFTRVA